MQFTTTANSGGLFLWLLSTQSQTMIRVKCEFWNLWLALLAPKYGYARVVFSWISTMEVVSASFAWAASQTQCVNKTQVEKIECLFKVRNAEDRAPVQFVESGFSTTLYGQADFLTFKPMFGWHPNFFVMPFTVMFHLFKVSSPCLLSLLFSINYQFLQDFAGFFCDCCGLKCRILNLHI